MKMPIELSKMSIARLLVEIEECGSNLNASILVKRAIEDFDLEMECKLVRYESDRKCGNFPS
jgi:hypothetical protein